jgi:rubrerythrin
MIADATPLELLVRFVAPLVWRNDAKIARKLDGFASTEAGSALDMLKAAELTDDPKLRRLFFRHAMDEARHAQLFRDAARRLAGTGRGAASEYNLIHATRQNLFETMGLVRFVAFVYLAERRGELQFRALGEHFVDRPELCDLFARIAKDEKFHVSYSRKLLRDWGNESQSRGREVLLALWYVRLARARDTWLRAGRLLGDVLSRICMSVIYLLVLPPFVLLSRWRDPELRGWKTRKLPSSIAAARRQF